MAAVARKVRDRDIVVASTCSVRPSRSSPAPWPITATAKHVTTTPAMESTAATRASCSRPTPPMLSMTRRPASVSSRSPTPGAIAPITRPIAAAPAVHDQTMVRCTRHVSAKASASRGEPTAGPGRASTSPDPRSRTWRSRWAATTSTSPSARSSSSTHQRGSDQALSRVDQPNGESHDSQPGPVSPTTLSR